MKIIDSKFNFPININIDSGSSNYDVLIDVSFDSLSKAISQFELNNKKICVITDSNLINCDSVLKCIRLLECTIESHIYSYVINAGEENKNEDTVKSAISFLLENNFNKDDILIAIGGGVITDITGFIAAIYKRGIVFLTIPTSLLAMTDSSVGGKNGINFLGLKNEIGTFKNPSLVYINTGFLKTLSIDLISEGMVEIIKSALIYDSDFLNYIINNINCIFSDNYENNYYLINLIYNAIQIKAAICSEDPYDEGRRHFLNFGHTIGHSIEKCTENKLTHGQAVAIGILCAIRISENKGLLSDKNLYCIVSDIFKNLRLPVSISQIKNYCRLDSCMADLEENILYYITKDKKNSSTGLKFVLLESVGRGIISSEVSEEDILGSF